MHLLVNMCAKFEVSSFNRPIQRYRGVPNCKSRSRDPFTICKYGVAGDTIFGFSYPNLPYSLYNFHGATMTLKGSLQVNIATVKGLFDAKLSLKSPIENWPKSSFFGEKNKVKITKNCFGPRKAHPCAKRRHLTY